MPVASMHSLAATTAGIAAASSFGMVGVSPDSRVTADGGTVTGPRGGEITGGVTGRRGVGGGVVGGGSAGCAEPAVGAPLPAAGGGTSTGGAVISGPASAGLALPAGAGAGAITTVRGAPRRWARSRRLAASIDGLNS